MAFIPVPKSVLKKVARARHKARKTPLRHFAPSIGSTRRSIIGTKLSPKEQKAVKKEKAKRAKQTKRQVRRIWRKVI